MVRPDETSSDPGPLHVSLPVLRGYATVLDDVSRDLGGCEALASSYCVDADFGKIVEDLTSDYATLLPQLQELLAENETVMAQYALAIDRTASDFAHTDDGVASRFQGDGINAGSGTTSFTVSSVGSSTPYAPEGELPEVSFGLLFDRLAWALETFVGWDVRGAVTDWIAATCGGCRPRQAAGRSSVSVSTSPVATSPPPTCCSDRPGRGRQPTCTPAA